MISGENLMAHKPQDVRVLKMLTPDSGDWFTYAGNAAEFGEEKYTIQSESGADIYTGNIVSTDIYRLLLMIRDGERFDLDGAANGRVIDPVAIVKNFKTTAAFKVSFQGRVGANANNEEKFEFVWTRNGTVITEECVTTDRNGDADITIPHQNSNLTLWAKGERTLAISKYIGTVEIGNTIDVGTLEVGDANLDNAVNMSDFYIFASNFGKKTTDAGFDRLADFNNDGEINMSDFFIFASNFGKEGHKRPLGSLMMPHANEKLSAAETKADSEAGCNAIPVGVVMLSVLALFILRRS